MRPVSIAILAGGQSRRMGRDKALLRLGPEGLTLLELAGLACQGLSDDLFVVAPPERGYDRVAPGLRIVADRFPGEGPAGGLITALHEARHACCLMLACDTPLLSRPLLRWLVEQADAGRAVIPWRSTASRQGGEATLELLHAIYPRTLLPELEQMFGEGERQLARLVTQEAPRLVPPEILVRFDPGLRSFRSLNRPEDVEWARALFAGREGGIY